MIAYPDDPPKPPDCEIALRTIAMPADANPTGDIFGGWLLSQMDLAGGVVAHSLAKGRLTTVAVEAMKFHLPVLVGDLVTCYGEIIRVGRTSIAVRVETWVSRADPSVKLKVTEGVFIYVALDEHRKPRPIMV